MSPPPTVSVIIATYNWSAALRLAIESVRLQTLQDFEVLVVGDACTDESAEVVASFGDQRLQWHNLETNHRGQWGPNNYGLGIARGEYIAYLGHDDIWYPTHLDRCIAKARASSADIVCGLLVLYGPPGSKLRALTGLFVDGVYSPSQFMPPTSVVHRRALIERIGPWRDPETIDIQVDNEFLFRAHAAAATFASTDEITAFKFNAAWRRGAYRERRVDEQAVMLERIKSGNDCPAIEMRETMRAVIEGRLIEVIGMRPGEGSMNSHLLAQVRRYKASPGALSLADFPPVAALCRFTIPEQWAPFEWHGLETHLTHGPFRWTGPHVVSTFEVPVTVECTLLGRLTVINAIESRALDRLELAIEGRRLSAIRSSGDGGATHFNRGAGTVEGAPT